MRAFCLMIFIAVALAVPATAVAQTPTDDIYDPVDVRTESRADTKGDLPYTGGDIALVVIAGAAILGTGVAIRRASRSTS